MEAEFVGHPLADLPLPAIAREEFAQQHGLNPDRTWIGLLPGSRAKEIRDNLPEMLDAGHDSCTARQQGCWTRKDFEFILPLAPTLTSAQRADGGRTGEELWRRPASSHWWTTPAPALFHARASVVASGTATVEAALIGNPFVVVYRVSPYLRHRQAGGDVPHVAMANLIAGERVVPELIQNDFTRGKYRPTA